MTKFLTRVELHGATEQDYIKLHSVMEAKGFSRHIKADNGMRYKLPPAEYYVDAATDIGTVRSAAVAAANSTNRQNAVLVCNTNSIAWQGLPVG